MRYLKLIFALVLGSATLLTAQAAPLTDFEFQSGPYSPAPTRLTLGYRFQVFSEISVDAIGVFDEGGDGLSSVHNLGLWDINDSANPLATGLVNAGAPTANADRSARNLGVYIYDDLSSTLALAPGIYVIGASYGPSNRDVVVDKPSGIISNSASAQVKFLGGAFGFEKNPAQVVFPEFMMGDGWFGPTLRISAISLETTTIPEPSTLALFIIATAALALGRRNRAARIDALKS